MACRLAFDVYHAVKHPTPKPHQWGLGFLSASVLGPWTWLSGIRWRRHLSTRGSGTAGQRASGLLGWRTGCPDFDSRQTLCHYESWYSWSAFEWWPMFPSSLHSPQWEKNDVSILRASMNSGLCWGRCFAMCSATPAWGLVEQRCKKLLWQQAGSTLGSRRENPGISSAQLVARPVPFSHSTWTFRCISFGKYHCFILFWSFFLWEGWYSIVCICCALCVCVCVPVCLCDSVCIFIYVLFQIYPAWQPFGVASNKRDRTNLLCRIFSSLS